LEHLISRHQSPKKQVRLRPVSNRTTPLAIPVRTRCIANPATPVRLAE
jgi:hypothetical protein